MKSQNFVFPEVLWDVEELTILKIRSKHIQICLMNTDLSSIQKVDFPVTNKIYRFSSLIEWNMYQTIIDRDNIQVFIIKKDDFFLKKKILFYQIN